MAVASGRDKVFKLIARGTELDLFQDETIYLSNNVTGLFDIGKLPSDFTRQLTLPGTKRNNAFFQHVYDISVDNPFLFKTNEKVIAQFDLDGFYVSQGYIQLEKVNLRENKYIESYEVSLYGLLSSFKKDLQNLTLNSLTELEKYNHVFEYQAISSSWDSYAYTGGPYEPGALPPANTRAFTSSLDGHGLGGEIVYAIQDSGEQIAFQSALPDNIFGIDNKDFNNHINAQNCKPAIRLDLVVDAIFDQLGYTYESTFLSESKFDNAYILCDRGLKFPVLSGVDLEIAGQFEAGPTSGSTVPKVFVSGVTQSLDFGNVYSNPDGAIIDSQGTYEPFFPNPTGASGVASQGLGNIKLNMKVSGSNTAYPEFTLYKNTPTGFTQFKLDSINRRVRQGFIGSGGDIDFDIDQDFELTFTSGSENTFALGFSTLGTGTVNVTLGPDGNEESRIKIKSLTNFGDLFEIDIAENMPFGTNGITCLDFIASLQKKFNLQIYPSKTKPRHFIIETFNNWYKQGTVKNFDKYMDLNRTISVTPANNLGVREVEFGDTLDVDFLAQNFNKENNREYGKSYFRDTQNFFSEGKLEVKSGFSSSPLRYVAGSGVTGSASQRVTSFQGVYGFSTNTICGSSNYVTLYHNGQFSEPEIGDIIYTDSLGTTPLFGYPYLVTNVSDTIYDLLPPSGQVIDDTDSCSGGGGGPTS